MEDASQLDKLSAFVKGIDELVRAASPGNCGRPGVRVARAGPRASRGHCGYAIVVAGRRHCLCGA
jgi:hypothetical protein